MLENPRSPRVRAVAKLTKRSARQETGLFLLEGPQAAREALAYRPDTVVELYATPTAMERHQDVRDAARAAGLDIEFTTEAVLDAMADTVTPQGIVAVARQSPTALKDVFAASPRLIAICEEVRDPGNLGTIIRAADAAGADGVVLTAGSVDVTSPKVIRSSAGSVFHLPVVRGAALAETVEALRGVGLTILAADGDGPVDLETTDRLAAPTAWIMGNEAHGISPDVRELADAVVAVPLRGHAESLNVAMAATIVLYASSRAHA